MIIKVALGVAAIGVGMLCNEGFVQVKVIEKQPGGHHIHVIAPAALAPIAAHFIPQAKLRRRRIRQYLPLIEATVEALRETDDIVLVEVKEPDEHVRVTKSGRSIVVDVDEPDETVHVVAPLRAISGVVNQIAADQQVALASSGPSGL